MNWLGELWRRLLYPFGRRRFDRDLEEEMRFHLEMKATESGATAARRQFGNQALLLEDSREAWGWGPIERLGQDLHYAIRMLCKNRGFTTVVLLTLALGIGANSVIFTVVHAVLLAPLPYREPARLVRVLGQKPHWGNGMSAPDAADLRTQNTVFEDLAVSGFAQADISGPGQPERVQGNRVSTNLFAVLGVAPLLGRGLEATDQRPGAPPVVLLSYGMWQRRFGGSPQALGETITMDKDTRAIVGVMPRWFQYPDGKAQYWIPLGETPLVKNRNLHTFSVLARLWPGVRLERARTEVKTIAARLERAFPKSNAGWSADAVELTEQMVGGVRSALLILLAAVGMVLLVACANVANLQWSRGVARRQEMALRAALGAEPFRLVRLLFTESLLLAASGGALGVLLAVWGVRALVPLYPPELPRAAEIRMDGAVLAFTMLLALGSAVLVGLAPALRTSRTDLNAVLKAGARFQGSPTGRSRAALAIAQVAMATVLLTSAGLLIKSFLLRTRVSGFVADDVLVVELPELPGGHLDVLLERIRALPGVVSAGSTTSFSYTRVMGIDVKLASTPKGDLPISAVVEVVTPDYFHTLRIPVRAGRAVQAADAKRSEPVVVINESFAQRYFPGGDSLGKQVVLATRPKETLAPIVGVVGDVPVFAQEGAAKPEIYLPYQAGAFAAAFQPDIIAVRTSLRPEQVAGAVQHAIRILEPREPIVRMETMRDDLSSRVAGPRFYTMLLGLFAGFALLLAAVGVYGVMSFGVSRRTHEIGLRMALGAQRGDVLHMVLSQGMVLIGAGLLLGLGGGWVATRMLETLLYRVGPHDIATLAAVPLVLGVAGLLACAAPARMATRIDPMVALRHE